jgi:GDP-4-dehydro-6-deoxy-D-mannose reductase
VRVVVTGANGFLGRHLSTALAAGGDEVVGISLERGELPAAIPFVAADVCDREALERAIDDAAPDAIVHLAALSHVGDSWKRIPDYFAVNILGTENVARAARGRRWLFSSSAEVYGAVPEAEQPIAEERSPAPRSPYALTKAVGERVALASGAVVVRSFNLVGPGQLPSFALPSFARQLAAIARRPPTSTAPPVLRVGNLAARRDFVDVLDAVAAYRLLLGKGSAATLYNLASGSAPAIAEMLDRLRSISGVAVTVEVDPERVRPLDVPVLCGDACRLRGLGWRPERGVDGALAALWQEASSVATAKGLEVTA